MDLLAFTASHMIFLKPAGKSSISEKKILAFSYAGLKRVRVCIILSKTKTYVAIFQVTGCAGGEWQVVSANVAREVGKDFPGDADRLV